MALFGFADISFNKGQTKRGPLAKLVGSEFERTTLRYPLDVGNYDKGHYVVFYIREQITTVPAKSRAPGLDFDVFGSGIPIAGSIDSSVTSKVANATSNFGGGALGQVKGLVGNAASNFGGGALGQVKGFVGNAVGKLTSGISGSVSNLFAQTGGKFTPNAAESQKLIDASIQRITDKGLKRSTRLTKDAIALYMPDTLQYDYSQSYDQLSLGREFIGGQLGAALKSAYDEYQKTKDISKLGASLQQSGTVGATQVAGRAAGAALGSPQTAAVLLARAGQVINPMLEMVYRSPSFRPFQFDFIFYPRDEREALEVQRILERFRFHQAPEIYNKNGTESSGFLVPPSEFDIKFYYAGNENPNIPQIATCVLTNISINYAPNGFSTYEVPGEDKPSLGRTGMPVAIQVTLQFQETTYLTRGDFLETFESRITLSK